MTSGIPMRPGSYDLMIITGDAWGKAVQLWAPGYGVLPEDLIVGDRIFYNGKPERIHSVTTQGQDDYVIMLRDGFIGDPWFKIKSTMEVRSALLEPVADAEASWLYKTSIETSKMIIPTTVDPDGATVEMIMLEDDTSALEEYKGVWRWDLHCNVRGRWICVLSGTMIIEHSVSMLVEAPLP